MMMKKKIIKMLVFVFAMVLIIQPTGKASANDTNTEPKEFNSVEEEVNGVIIIKDKIIEGETDGLPELEKNEDEMIQPRRLLVNGIRQVFINPGDKTKTSTRINGVNTGNNTGESLTVNLDNKRGKKFVSFVIFRNGDHFQTYGVGAGESGNFYFGFPPSGHYSIRAYCNVPNALQTGCQANGTIQVRKK